jgi:geranylgeranyl pyrophosphate synthase
MTLADLQLLCIQRTDQLYHKFIKFTGHPSAKLQDAMGYALFNGGKRVRPLLVYAAGLALGGAIENLDAPAAAIELIHTYSLIHDDLPAMDNADLRRGKPSCHKVFGDAMAILAGDALQTLAFQIITDTNSDLSAAQRIDMIAILSQASGQAGMAGGQALDITEKISDIDQLTHLNQLKTGALLTACVKLGAIAANNAEHSLVKYADCLGLAFQIQDDILDIESDVTTIGKPVGIDAINQKITYPTLLGIDNSRQKVQELIDCALSSLDSLGNEATTLRELAEYLLQRKQ